MEANKMTITRKQILKCVDSKYLILDKIFGHAYFVLTYEDTARGIYEQRSVLISRLNQLTLAQWKEEGLDFINSIN
jgi:hypothetical protein